ncbi:MAG: DUF6522 family protein [Bryobacteraceae bacterium]
MTAAPAAADVMCGWLSMVGKRLLQMDEGSPDGVAYSKDGFVVDAEVVAGELGLSPGAFWREIKRGIVYGVVERGEGDDAGRVRLTFRYRARSWSTTIEDTAA